MDSKGKLPQEPVPATPPTHGGNKARVLPKDKVPPMYCKYYGQGNCTKGDACDFKHALPPVEAPTKVEEPKALIAKKRIVFDKALSEVQKGKLEKTFGVEIQSAKEPFIHAEARCARLCGIDALYRSIPAGRILEKQGRPRGPERDGTEFCRHWISAQDDEEVSLCKFGCEHDVKLKAGGHYDYLVCVDVPITPKLAEEWLANPGIKAVYALIHVYDPIMQSLFGGEQTAVWSPCGEFTAESYEESGSIGQFEVATLGGRTVVEGDHHWLSGAGRALRGVRPETIASYPEAAYEVVRLVKSRDIFLVPDYTFAVACVANIGLMNVHGVLCAKFRGNYIAGNLSMGTGRGCEVVHCEMSEIKLVYGKVNSRDTTASTRATAARVLNRSVDDVDVEAVVGLVLEVKRNAEEPLLEREYRGDGLFQWLGKTRIARDAYAAQLRARNYAWLTFGPLLIAFAFLSSVVSVVPWPAQVCSSSYWVRPQLSWWWTGGSWLQFQLPWISPGSVCTWEFSYTVVSFAYRGLLLASVFALLVGGAYAVQPEFPMDTYLEDRFAPLEWSGRLEAGFGLPGWTCDRPDLPQGANTTMRLDPTLGGDDDVDSLRPRFWATTIVFGYAIPHVAVPNQANMAKAVRNRQIARMPAADQAVFSGHAEKFFKRLAIVDFQFRLVEFEEWNQRFPLFRQARQCKALLDLEQGSLSDHEICVRNMFSKIEKIFKRVSYDPRCILGGSDAWNVMFGPWMYSIGNSMAQAFGPTGNDAFPNVYYATATTPQELGCWFARALDEGGKVLSGDDQLIVVIIDGKPVLIEVDGKRHDAHMHEGFHEFKWTYYGKIQPSGHWPKSIHWVREQSRNTYARSRVGVKCTFEYRVRSGDPDTTKGNTSCTHLVAEVIEEAYKVAVCESHDPVEAAVDAAAQLGYEIDIKVSSSPSDVTFLSGVFVPVDGEWLWTPKMGRLIASLGWTVKLSHFEGAPFWTRVAGDLNSFSGYRFLPFFRVYYELVLELIPEKFRAARSMEKRTVTADGPMPLEPGSDTWAWVSRRYGLSLEDEVSFSRELEPVRIFGIPYMVSSTVFKVIAEVDVYG